MEDKYKDETVVNSEDVLITTESLCSMIGVSRSTLFRMIRKGDIPKPRHLNGRFSFWVFSELKNIIDQVKS